jgi:murein DD-endopeptidase MepM/ murein hydrolase activator NlpD
MKRLATVVLALLCGACVPAEEPDHVSAAATAASAAIQDVLLPPDVRKVSARVMRGATLASLLRAHEIAEEEVGSLVARAAAVFDLRKVRVNQPYVITQAISGALRQFEYEIDGDRVLRITRQEEAAPEAPPFVAAVVPIEKIARVETVRGVIDDSANSLFAAVDRAGETGDLAVALAQVFGSEIDFNTEIQPDDRFQLVVEKQYRVDDQFGGYGPILAAEIVNDGRRVRAIRFTPEGGSAGYFDENGVSLRRFFLRSPLKFEPVVTSSFSRRRYHPVLHTYRAHNGVDYRAPHGAPVVAVADGTVVFAAMNGGSGRMVHLRHPNGFETQYLHLSTISVRRGARVEQGDVIGRVGATGLATGPHLHYQLKKNGALINPVTAHRAMPPGDPVPASQLEAFRAVRDRALAAFEAAPSAVPATSAVVTTAAQ